MKQLKFNHDKDMKELEKYGFYKKEYYSETFYEKGYLAISGDRELDISCDLDMLDLHVLLLEIYNLIKANLLIVESDEDES